MTTVLGERAAPLAATDRPAAASAIAFDQADLFQCLARAFLPPPEAMTAWVWCSTLAADLVELGGMLALDVGPVLAELNDCARGPLAEESWLVEYSGLFLVPPVDVPLNTGVYLEGSIGGSASHMMRQCYATAGFAQRGDFFDLPDHVAAQFEFLAALLDRAAQGDTDAAAMACEFADGFVRHWIDPLQAACARAGERYPAARVFAGLIDVARAALAAIEVSE